MCNGGLVAAGGDPRRGSRDSRQRANERSGIHLHAGPFQLDEHHERPLWAAPISVGPIDRTDARRPARCDESSRALSERSRQRVTLRAL